MTKYRDVFCACGEPAKVAWQGVPCCMRCYDSAWHKARYLAMTPAERAVLKARVHAYHASPQGKARKNYSMRLKRGGETLDEAERRKAQHRIYNAAWRARMTADPERRAAYLARRKEQRS